MVKIMTTEEKAKRYDEALERAKDYHNDYTKDIVEDIFPELKESKEEWIERLRKEIITFLGNKKVSSINESDAINVWLAWLEKQCGITKLSEEEQNKFAKGVLSSCALSFINYLDAHLHKGKMCVSNFECEDIENAFHNAMWDKLHRYYCKYIEKQGEKPASQSEFKVGDSIKEKDCTTIYKILEICKDGSLFVEDNLTIPYSELDKWELVKKEPMFKVGDFVKDTNHHKQPIYKIVYIDKECYICISEDVTLGDKSVMHFAFDNPYLRLVEQKQDPCKACNNPMLNCNNFPCIDKKAFEKGKSVLEVINEEKVEPKFKVGDWVVQGCNILKIRCVGDEYYCFETVGGYVDDMLVSEIDSLYHLWTIQDAKDGDVLHSIGFHSDCIFIFNGFDNWKFDEPNGDRVVATGYCCLFVSADKMEFGTQGPDCVEVNTIKPATKEQRDTLMKAMADAGYTFDFEKKELKKIGSLPSFDEQQGTPVVKQEETKEI